MASISLDFGQKSPSVVERRRKQGSVVVDFIYNYEDSRGPSNGHVSVFEMPTRGEHMPGIVVFFFGVTKS
jgi:hypothetical protein